MSASKNRNKRAWGLFAGLGIAVAVGLTGCQVDMNGQTLPSPYYFDDDVQYFPHGPEFKLSREAAQLEAYSQERLLRQ